MNNTSQERIEVERNLSFDVLFDDNLNPEKILPVIRECVSVSKNDSEINRAVEVALRTCIRNYSIEDLEDIFQLACPAGASLFVDRVNNLEEHSNPFVDDCITSFNFCLKIVASFQDAFRYLNQVQQITIGRVESLLVCSLDMLLKCFSHCKSSEEVYGALFNSLTDYLSGFFKKNCGLLDLLLDFLMEKSVLDLESEKEISLLDLLLRKVSKCGIIMVDLEVKTMAKIWKTYIYLLEKYLCVLKMEYEVGDTINALCEVIISNVGAFKTEDSSKLVKLSCFLLKLIIKLCEIFKSEISKCHGSLFNLLLTLCKCEGGLIGEKNQKEDSVSQLTVGVDPLVSLLLGDRQLVKEFGRCQNVKKTEEFCLLCCLVLKKLTHSKAAVRCLWINERENIFDWLFTAASTSQFIGFSPVRLPNVVVNWQQMKFTDLYEYASVTVSAFLITASADEFNIIEKTLIRNVLQPDLIPALLAMDIWAFLARIADSDLCYSQILALSDMLQKLHPQSRRMEKCYLASLIRRLFLFLTDSRQKEYMKCFSSSFYSSIWDPRAVEFIPRHEVCDVIRPIVSQYGHLIRKTECDFNQEFSGNEHAIYLAFGEQILDLWKFNCDLLPSDSKTDKFLKVACGLVSSIVAFVTSEDLLAVLSQMKKLLSVRLQPTAVKLYFLWILSALSSVSISPTSNQMKILLTVAEIFRELLSSREIMAKQRALEVFESFTRATTHEEVIAMTVRNSSELKMEILAFFKKELVDCSPNQVEEFLRRLFELQHEHVCEMAEPEPGLSLKRIKLDVPDLEGVVARFREDGDVIREFARSLSDVQKREIKSMCSSILSEV